MRVHYLQHVSFEEPAAISDWAVEAGHIITCSHLYRGDALPDRSEFGLLVVMGGPMSVNDEKEYPWLIDEKRLLKATIDSGRPVIGVCLGAQMIASAMGARVYRCAEKEIGWFPVRRVTSEGLGALLPETFTPLHWHGETFDLPSGAVRLAETDVTPNQAFQLGNNIIGVQFHLEATTQSVAALVRNAGDEIDSSRPFQQKPQTILAETRNAAARVRPILQSILAQIASCA